MPITRVLDADGNTLHDCTEAGCVVSWDGFPLIDGYTTPTPDPANPGQTIDTPVGRDEQVPGASALGPQWDTSVPGVARLRPAG